MICLQSKIWSSWRNGNTLWILWMYGLKLCCQRLHHIHFLGHKTACNTFMALSFCSGYWMDFLLFSSYLSKFHFWGRGSLIKSNLTSRIPEYSTLKYAMVFSLFFFCFSFFPFLSIGGILRDFGVAKTHWWNHFLFSCLTQDRFTPIFCPKRSNQLITELILIWN